MTCTIFLNGMDCYDFTQVDVLLITCEWQLLPRTEGNIFAQILYLQFNMVIKQDEYHFLWMCISVFNNNSGKTFKSTGPDACFKCNL